MPAHMPDDRFTLRPTPDSRGTVLCPSRGELSPPTELWDLDLRRQTADSIEFEFVPMPGSPGAAANRIRRPEWILRDPGPVSLEKRARARHSSGDVATVSHSAERVANAIVLATSSPLDLRTLNAWGQHVGVSRGALRVWCKAAGAPARSCLDFMRVLRAVVVSRNRPWDLLGVLDVVDQRTLTQLLERGSVRQLCRRGRPSVEEFLARQRYIRDETLLLAVARQMTSAGMVSGEDATSAAAGRVKGGARKTRRSRTT